MAGRDKSIKAGSLWEPDPDNIPQCDAYLSKADELFFGGSAGGGKSDLGLGLAITTHRNSVIFRREFWQARELIERSKEIIGSAGRFNENLHLWRDLPGGRRIEFGGLQRAGDWQKWKGRPHDLYVFDEGTEILEIQYRNITAWLRTTYSDQRCRILVTGNPPTSEEGQWVIRHWAPWLDRNHPNPAKPGELRWFVRMGDEDIEVDGPDPVEYTDEHGRTEMLIPRSRTFIPAGLEDNKYLRDSGYREVLQSTPEPLRSQLLYGDFTLTQVDDPFQVIPSEWIDAAMQRWKENPKPETGLDAVGCDPSRGGKNKTVISQRYGVFFAALIKYPGHLMDHGSKVATKVIEALGKWRKTARVNIDPLGVGSSPNDYLRDAKVQVNGVNFAAKAIDFSGQPMTDRSGKYKFANVRAAASWKLRESLHPDYGDELRLPPDPELRQELVALRYSLRPQGIIIKPKDEIAEDLGRSPDSADAVILARWQEGAIGSWEDVEGLGHVENFESKWT